MGFWSSAAYLQTKYLEDISSAITSLASFEGFHPFEPEKDQVISDRRKKETDVWAFAIIPGSEKWSIIASYPADILCETAQGREHPRLSYLAFLVNSNAVHYSVYDDVDELCIECTSMRTSIYGWRPDAESLYEHIVGLDRSENNQSNSPNPFTDNTPRPPKRIFHLLPELIALNDQLTRNSSATAELIAQTLTGRDKDYWGNRPGYDLFHNAKVAILDALTLFFRRVNGAQ